MAKINCEFDIVKDIALKAGGVQNVPKVISLLYTVNIS